MAIMNLSIENFTCSKEHISLYLSVLKQLTLSKTVWNQISTKFGSWLADFSCKQCRSRSAGFWRSQLIRIHTVFNARCELLIINQNMKYRIVLTNYICTCLRASKLKFSTCPQWNGTRSDKSGMVFPQPWITVILPISGKSCISISAWIFCNKYIIQRSI